MTPIWSQKGVKKLEKWIKQSMRSNKNFLSRGSFSTYALHVPRNHQVAPVYAHKMQNHKQQILHLGKVHVGKMHLSEVHLSEVHV